MIEWESPKVKMTLYREGTIIVRDEQFPNIRAAHSYRDMFLPGTTGYIKSLSGGILEYLR
jgi:hypothetical protein